jgi:predicted unusual protein kinase regulating ubiquinone biosynthesis (AarF/ABC1/UbiB family)
MEFISGEPIDALVSESAGLRNAVATRLVKLFLKEVFALGVVQTDPNLFPNWPTPGA